MAVDTEGARFAFGKPTAEPLVAVIIDMLAPNMQHYTRWCHDSCARQCDNPGDHR